MEVILFDDVKGLGRQGDLVKVSDGHFRNFLKPKNLAEEASPAALQRYEKMKKKVIELAAQKVSEAKELESRLTSVIVKLKAKAGDRDKLFGAVTSQDIVKAMEEHGYTIDKKQIEMPDPIKTLGEHTAKLRIHPEVVASLKLLVEKA